MSDGRDERYCTAADGTRLSYLDEGEGPGVVLLHALTANWYANWVEPGLVDPLVEAGYRVIAPDARGHGRSEESASAGYHPDVLARDVADLVSALGLEPVSLVGYSYGSRTAAQLAAAGQVKVRSLVLGGADLSTMEPFPDTPEMEMVVTVLAAEDPSTVPDPGLVAMRQRMADWNARPNAIAGIYGEMRRASPIALETISAPTLVLCSPQEPGDLVSTIPGARSVIVRGDHLSAPNDPAFGEALLAFLCETDPA